MSEGIGWKTAELQIESLVPGILLVFEFYQWLPFSKLRHSEFVKGAVWVAMAYTLGLLCSVVSRIIVDSISEWGPQAWILQKMAHVEIVDIISKYEEVDNKFANLPAIYCYKSPLKDPKERAERLPEDVERKVFDEKENKIKGRAPQWLRSLFHSEDEFGIPAWSEIYRFAVKHTSRETEVDRRRSQGRLIRNLTVPIMVVPWIYPEYAAIKYWWAFVPSSALLLVAMVFIYAYAEYINFAEANDIGIMVRNKPNQSSSQGNPVQSGD